MKITLKEEKGAEKELIIRCESVDNEVREIISLLSLKNKRIAVLDGTATKLIDPFSVMYCESVDSNVFAYTKEEVKKTVYSLREIESAFSSLGFFRCSKSMVMNICFISGLKSISNGRIIATLSNGERIVVSRKYAKELRKKLIAKGGLNYERI
ncbi:MAG: LytTR family DNA-binding domain-containing protein [Lachnospiraceae bacterium]|nr:LytTR family DNA-binding domain-containing protein [Lachnospiraceae bacterium]